MIKLLLAVLLCPVFASAAAGGSEWIEADAAQGRPDDPGSVDRDRFREGFQNRTLDNICRMVRLTATLKLNPLEHIGIQIGARRSLRRYADGTLALVDETPLGLSLGYSADLVELSDKMTMGAFFSARFDGRSTVVLPIKDSSCGALKTMLNPLKLKSVMPLSGIKDLAKRQDLAPAIAARIMAMEQGEVWKLSIKPTVGWGPSVTVPVGEASFSAHWQFSRSRGESVTLKRLSPTQVRYRLRVDSVKIVDKGAGVSGSVTTADLGVDDNIAYSQLVRQFNQYFKAHIAAGRVAADGREILLEYVLDPTDPAQMEALVRAALGDIKAWDGMKAMVRGTGKRLSSDEDMREGLESLVDGHDAALDDAATFAAGDEYKRPSSNFSLHVPFLFRYDSSRSDQGRERIVLLDDKGGEIHLFPAQSRTARGIAEIPVLGDLDRYEKSLGVQVYTYTDKDGRRDTANAVFVEQRAFTREGAWTPNGMIEGVNGVMRYAGMRGNGADARKELPLKPFKAENPLAARPIGGRAVSEPPRILYDKGMSAFTLILSRKAIADMLQTTASDVARAYENALDETKKSLYRRGVAGTLNAGPTTRENRIEKQRAQAEYAGMAGVVADLVKGLEKARGAKSPEEQAAAVRDLLAGSGGGAAYSDVLKVLIQFVDPADIAGIVDIEVRGGEQKRMHKRFLLNKDGADSELVRSYAAARARFVAPTITSD